MRSNYGQALGQVRFAKIIGILDDPAQSLRAREAEAMCDHVWIFEARTLSQSGRRCGMCGAGTGWNQAGGPDQEKPRAALGVALVLARPAVANWWISNREGSVSGGLFRSIH